MQALNLHQCGDITMQRWGNCQTMDRKWASKPVSSPYGTVLNGSFGMNQIHAATLANGLIKPQFSCFYCIILFYFSDVVFQNVHVLTLPR